MKEVRVNMMTMHGLVKLCQPTQAVVISFVWKLNSAEQHKKDAGSCKYDSFTAISFTLMTGVSFSFCNQAQDQAIRNPPLNGWLL